MECNPLIHPMGVVLLEHERLRGEIRRTILQRLGKFEANSIRSHWATVFWQNKTSILTRGLQQWTVKSVSVEDDYLNVKNFKKTPNRHQQACCTLAFPKRRSIGVLYQADETSWYKNNRKRFRSSFPSLCSTVQFLRRFFRRSRDELGW